MKRVGEIFRRVTGNRDEQENLVSMIAKDGFFTLHSTFVALPVVQAFLITYGASDLQLGLTNTFMNVFLLLSVMFFMGRIDAIEQERIVGLSRSTSYTFLIFPSALLLTSFFGGRLSSDATFVIVAVVWSIYSFVSMGKFMIDMRVS